MILLEKYIKAFLKEAASTAIANKANDLTGMSHHQKAASYSNDMSEIDNQEALLKVLENVGNNCFISFVEKYDEKIPRLEVSPEVSYDTPHGNYAYPLTIKSLKDIIEKGRIGGAHFALERPYFHMFKKSDSLNSIEIQSDGRNNYRGNYSKDLRTIVHTAVMFNAARALERNPAKYAAPSDSDEEENRVINFNWTKRRIKRKIRANSTPSHARNSAFNKTMFSLSEDLCYLFNLNNKKFPRDVVELIVDYLIKSMEFKINSRQNKFFVSTKGENKFFVSIKGERKLLSKFHGLFYTCFILAKDMSDDVDIFEDDDANAFDVDKINNPQKNKVRQGSIFTMLLNSIDIDFINDKGSSTLHSNEPIQAVYLNSSKKESVALIGTFNNIFYDSSKNLFGLFGSSQNSSKKEKSATMNKIVNIVSSNEHLTRLFDTPLFDNPNSVGNIDHIREKAWDDLTYDMNTLVRINLFSKQSKIFNFNIKKGAEGVIVFDIGFKQYFTNKNEKEKLSLIDKEALYFVSVSEFSNTISQFLIDYENKNVYKIKDDKSYLRMKDVIDEIQDSLSSYEGPNIIKTTQAVKFFIITSQELQGFCQHITQQSSI